MNSRHIRYRVIQPLEDRGIIRETAQGEYALSILLSDLDEIVDSALNQFREEGFEQVSLNDLANKVGKSPSEIEKTAYRLAPNRGLTVEQESRKKGLWNNIKFQLEKAGGSIEELYIKRISTQGRDPTTDWKRTIYEEKEVISGITILEGATRLITAASKLGIYFKREYKEETMIFFNN
jgi:hypothetical protein